MKKIIVLLMTVVMVISLGACGKKSEASVASTSSTASKSSEAPKGDPVEYSQEYWAKKYPDANICPFKINIDGVDYAYYWIRAMAPDDDLAAWAKTDMNWNGWHMVGDKLVDKDEKHAITADSRKQSFSSGCVYKTEAFDASSAQGNNATGTAKAYSFKGYTEKANWLDADSWAGLGLPKLTMSDDVNGKVHISDKDWIYPLKGSDGVLIECTPSSSQIDAIISDLKNAGISMTEESGANKTFVGKYSFSGKNMKITVSESQTGKISVLVITNPTD